MEYKDIEAMVKHTYAKPYRVKYADGKTAIVRLWIASNGLVAKLSKRKKIHGYVLSYYDYMDWVSLKEVEKKPTSTFALMKKRATDALKYLTQSGMWSYIKKEIEYFLSDDAIIQAVADAIEKDSYECFYKECRENGKFPWCHTTQVFETFAAKKCWQSIPYQKWERERMNQRISNAIEDRQDFHYRWTNGYDNTIEIGACSDGELRGWLSCEFRGCGNGHYYLLFDATHAIFYEDD